MSGIFNASIFNNSAFNTGGAGAVVTPDVVKTGTGGIDPYNIVKPLGTLGLPRKKKSVEARIADSRAIQAEVAAQIAREFSEELALPPIRTMSMAEVHFEIGTLLRKTIRTQEDEATLIILMIAAAL